MFVIYFILVIFDLWSSFILLLFNFLFSLIALSILETLGSIKPAVYCNEDEDDDGDDMISLIVHVFGNIE